MPASKLRSFEVRVPRRLGASEWTITGAVHGNVFMVAIGPYAVALDAHSVSADDLGSCALVYGGVLTIGDEFVAEVQEEDRSVVLLVTRARCGAWRSGGSDAA